MFSTTPVIYENSNEGFGNGGGWVWIILIILLLGCGWNNGGWGGFGGNQGSTSVYEGYVLNNDFSQLSRQIDNGFSEQRGQGIQIANGIASLGYDQLAQMNGINTNIMTVGNAIQTQLADCCCKTQSGIERINTGNAMNTATITSAIKDCCCQTQQNLADVKYAIGSTGADISRGVERGFSDTNYNLATQTNMLDRTISDKFCQTNFNAQTNTRDVIDSQNAGTQAILAKLDAMETNRLREKLEAERDAKYALQGQLDRAQLRTQIVDDVRPCPKPAYITCNPFGCNCQQNVYGTTIA